MVYGIQYEINLWATAVLLFEGSSAVLRSNEDLEGPECSNYHQRSGCAILWLNILFLSIYLSFYLSVYLSIHIYICIYIYIYIYTYI